MQAYEDEQRQEIAAETVEAVMYPNAEPVSEPEIESESHAQTEALAEVVPVEEAVVEVKPA